MIPLTARAQTSLELIGEFKIHSNPRINMKTCTRLSAKAIVLSLLALITMSLATSCAARGHAGRHSTGAGINTPIGGLGGAVRY